MQLCTGSPHIVGTADTPLMARGVAVPGGCACVADEDYTHLPGSLRVIDVSDPHDPQIVGNLNALQHPMGVALVDTHAYISDRSVRRLSSSTGHGLARDLRWDGRDGSNRPVPAGVYLVRAAGIGDLQAAARLVVIR